MVLCNSRKKEIENYLLVPSVLDRALTREIQERERRHGSIGIPVEPMTVLLEKLTTELKSELQAQYLARRSEFLSGRGKDVSTINLETMNIFDEKWEDIGSRMNIVPGKDVLSTLRGHLQKKYKVNLTNARIIDAMSVSEIAPDLRSFLNELEQFRKAASSKS